MEQSRIWMGVGTVLLALAIVVSDRPPVSLSRETVSARDHIQTLFNVPVRMSDGTRLSADVYLPGKGGPYPVLLTRTPYDNMGEREVSRARFFASHGYGVVVQDVRGRYDSDGRFYPLLHEAQDGYETLQWCARQPWCNGEIGTYGGSYAAATEWLAAALRPEHLKAMVSIFAASDYHEDWVYKGGAFQLSFNLTWGAFLVDGRTNQSPKVIDWTTVFSHLPLTELPQRVGRRSRPFQDWLKHPEDGAYWRRWSHRDHYHRIDVPVLHIGGWYDVFINGTLGNFIGMTTKGGSALARRSQKLVIGPWFHYWGPMRRVGAVDFGEGAIIDLDRLMLRWFDFWLKGVDNGIMGEPPVRLFVMGRNRWRDESQWPPQRARMVAYYLHSGGSAHTNRGDGTLNTTPPDREPNDTFTYDPANPVPTHGGNVCCFPGIVPEGAWDQREIEARPDVLVYTSPVLEEDLEITGPVKVILFAASSAPDTDFTAKLVDVHPGGFAQNICDGIIRARYRASREKPEFLQPGHIYRYEIDLGATSQVFKSGHRVRLEISSSNFPRFDRNLNTKAPIGFSARFRVAKQTVYHTRKYPSRVLLPVMFR
ncbi:MAG: CocE/NonD family hydrolase [Acidobacteria bacterium]|nr:MAG: CocE/NonD family hydrolase [Acidobacteriota bacterium]